MSSRERAADPVLVEIVRNGVMAVTEEMKVNLMRTAYNMIIYEALDFTVGLFTREGDTVSIGLGLPMFIRGMAETVKAKIKRFGADGFEPGDILLTPDGEYALVMDQRSGNVSVVRMATVLDHKARTNSPPAPFFTVFPTAADARSALIVPFQQG